jgi:hypothetical protein
MKAMQAGLLVVSLLGFGLPALAQDDGAVAAQTNTVVFHIEGMT